MKMLTALTMENIAETVVKEVLASGSEVDQLVRDLYAFAHDASTLLSSPRIVEIWASAPIRASAPSSPPPNRSAQFGCVHI